MSELYDAPNQQAVRPDGSAPWDEGEGGSWHPEAGPQAETDLDSMTKAELLDYAAQHDIEAEDYMTKAEIREAIEAG